MSLTSLYSAGTRQMSSIQKDLEVMERGDGGAAIQGQISTTLAAFSRLIDDYARLINGPNTPADKREKAQLRLQRFKEEHSSLKALFEKRKQEAAEKTRKDLLGPSDGDRTKGGSTSINVGAGAGYGPRLRPNAPNSPTPGNNFAESPFSASGYQPNHPPADARADFALDENSFLQRSEHAIDDYLAQGKAVLDDLVDQRNLLRKTNKGLAGVGETLGLSRQTIGWVERRTAQDWYIFVGGSIFTLFMFWVIYHYLG